MAEANGRPSKRRKVVENVIKIGNKVISLDGYLKAPEAKTSEPGRAAQQLNDNASTHQTTTTSNQDSSKKRSKGNETPSTVGGHHRNEDASVGRARLSKASSKQNEAGQFMATRQALPIWKHQHDIKEALAENDVLILVGETGSGKSTQVPQFLLKEPWCRKKVVKARTGESEEDANVGGAIAVTQPRRVAATTLAHRVSQEAGTPLGKTPHGLVGYSVRFDHNVPQGTRIKYLTEGMLLQEMLRDPDLRQYSAVVVDEIHERSVDVDLICGLLKQILHRNKAGRGGIPLKVVAMSATADIEQIRNFFASPLSDLDGSEASVATLKIAGRQYPVDILYEPKPVPDLQDMVLKTIFKIHLHQPLPGDILVFLWGQEEIESIQRMVEEYAATLASNLPKVAAFPLFGQLSIEAQHKAFQPVEGKFTRKVVLATNIAETSVTVPGVRYVIDCGKAKVKQFRTRLGMESLLAKPISKSSAIQRTGRAGREGPGRCYRLYTEDAYENLQAIDLPEILRTDVLGAVLTMKARGIDNVLSFPYLDTPDTESLEKALVHLHLLSALDDKGQLTEMGRQMAFFPVTAPYARVLLAAAGPNFDCLLEVIDVIACLTSGEDIFQQVQSEEARESVKEFRSELYRREGDLLTYLNTMQRYTAENADRVAWCKARRLNIRNMKQALNIRRQLRGQCLKLGLLNDAPPPDPQPFTPLSPERAQVLIKCFIKGFVLKTAMMTPDGSYVTTQGKHAVAVHPSSVLWGQKKEAILFLEYVFTQKSYAKKVSAIEAVWIAEALEGKW